MGSWLKRKGKVREVEEFEEVTGDALLHLSRSLKCTLIRVDQIGDNLTTGNTTGENLIANCTGNLESTKTNRLMSPSYSGTLSWACMTGTTTTTSVCVHIVTFVGGN